MHLLDNHLRNTLSTQGLAALKSLTLETSKRIEDGSKRQEDCADDQACCLRPNTDPLHSAQHGIEAGTHVVCLDLTDEGIEFGRRRADAKEQRDLNEDDEERGHSALGQLCQRRRGIVDTYKQTMLNAITKVGWKMFAMPSAKQRMMHNTPVLLACQLRVVRREPAQGLFIALVCWCIVDKKVVFCKALCRIAIGLRPSSVLWCAHVVEVTNHWP